MRLIYISLLLQLFLAAHVSFGQTPFSGNKFETNTIFVKIKDVSDEHILYSGFNKRTGLNTELKNIIETYKISSIAAAFHTTEKTDARLKRVFTVSFPISTQREAIMSALRKLPFIDYVETIPVYELFLTPNDLNPQQWNLPRINAVGAWDLSTGSGKVIAIVDDAVRLTHEDLAANIWNNPLEINGNGIDDDGNGYIDDIHGYDVADNDNNPMVPATATNSEFSHGTHCSGIAAGVSNNGKGIASIGYSNKIMAVKCKQSSSLGGSLPYAYSGLAYAIETNADVISMSWGGYYYSYTYQLLFDVAYDAGIICVAAAGNSNTDILMYPASYNHVISVAATDQNDLRAYFSNYGSKVDVSAPGVDIYSTLAGSNNSYGMQSGTSMACPLVSGLCALMLSYDPSLTPDELERCLKDNADNLDNLNPGYSGELGAGRINAYKTMLCLQKTPTAAFKSDKQLICPGGAVSYIDMSMLGVNSGVAWNWSFPGGTPATSTDQNPTVVYNNSGSYPATLTVTNTFGNNTLTKTNYITVAPLSAVLSGTTTIALGGYALLKVDFSSSTGPYSITYTDGTATFTKNNITSNPFYFAVTLEQTTTYRLTSVSTSNCTGTYSGIATVTVGNSDNSLLMMKRMYGDSDASKNCYGNNLIQSSSGENYLIGMNAENTSSADFSISKLNTTWDIVWTKGIGTSAVEYIYGSTQSADGNIVMCGTSIINGTLDAYVAKVDLDGNIIWSKTYGSFGDEYGYSIQNTSDGGYILAGRTDSYSGSLDSYIVKMDATGTVQWTKAFGRGGNDYTFTCSQTPDGGYVIASVSQTSGFSNYDYLITKLTSTGDVSWSKYYGSVGDEGPRKLIVTSDGGFLIGGSSRYINSAGDAMVTKLDASGNLVWSKTYGDDGADDVFIVQESVDGDYLVAGITDDNGSGDKQIHFSKFDVHGNLLWSKLYGYLNIDTYFPAMGSIVNSSDGGYILIGTAKTDHKEEMYLIKTDFNGNTSNGNTDCFSPDVTFHNFSITPSLYPATLTTDMSASGNDFPVSISIQLSLDATSYCAAFACTTDADFYATDTIVCAGTLVDFLSTSTNAAAYKWYLDNALIGDNNALSHTFVTEGDYKMVLEVSNGSCSDIDTLIISVQPNPELVVSNDTTICNATRASLLVSGAATYQWLDPSDLSCNTCSNPIATPSISRYYTVIGASKYGCTTKDSVRVKVRCCVADNIPSPAAVVTVSDSIICLNDEVLFSAVYTGNMVVPSWDFGPAATPPYSTGDISPITVRYSQPGRWPAKLIFTDDCGKDSVTTYINVFNPPVVDAYPDVFLCSSPGRVQFDITPISDQSYSWTPAFGLSDPLIANPWVDLVDTSIVYRRTTRDNNTGCEASDEVKVSSHTSFQIHAMNDTSIVSGQEVTLKACCGAYTWLPSTYLNNASVQNPIAAPYASIWYYVQSIDTIGCIARDSVLISVTVLEPFIPNLITPNGDQLNDTFKIRNLCPGSHVEIYNSWGELVFKSENYKDEWDGVNQSDGMYYVLFQSGCGGKPYKSWLQLLRIN